MELWLLAMLAGQPPGPDRIGLTPLAKSAGVRGQSIDSRTCDAVCSGAHTSPPAPPAPWLRCWFVRWLLLLLPPPFRRRSRVRRSRPQAMRSGFVGWLATEVGSGRNFYGGHTAFDPAPHRMLLNHSPRIIKEPTASCGFARGRTHTKPRLPTIIEARIENVRHRCSFVQEKHFMLANAYPDRPRCPLSALVRRAGCVAERGCVAEAVTSIDDEGKDDGPAP
jgi:hypothetical protein